MATKLHKRISALRTPVAAAIMVVVATHHIVIQRATAGWHLPSEILVYGIGGPIVSWILLGWLARSVAAAEQASDAQAESAARLARRNAEIEALYSASRLLTGARSLSHIASALLQLAVQITRANSGALVLFDADGDEGSVMPATGDQGASLRADLLAHTEAGPCLTCPESPRCPLPGDVHCFPIVAGRHVLGILRLAQPVLRSESRQSLDTLLSEIAAVWMARQAESRALTAFGRAGQELQDESDIGRVLDRFAELVCDACAAAAACLYLRDGGDWSLRVASHPERPAPLPGSMPADADAVWQEKKGRFVYVLVEGKSLLALDFAGVRPLNQRDADLLKSLAAQANVLARLAQQMSDAVWRERQRMAQELHDGLAQNIAFLNLQIRRVSEMFDDRTPDAVRADLYKLSQAALDTYDELRMAIGDLRSHPDSGETSLAFLRRVVDAFARREAIDARFDAPDDLAVTEEALAQLTRIVQEALSNAVRHGGARRVEIVFAVEAGGTQLHVSIRDDGVGFDTADADAAAGHYGFKTMRERADQLASSIWFESWPGKGTTVHLRLPETVFKTADDDRERSSMAAT